jgi:hypothetical protein
LKHGFGRTFKLLAYASPWSDDLKVVASLSKRKLYYIINRFFTGIGMSRRRAKRARAFARSSGRRRGTIKRKYY